MKRFATTVEKKKERKVSESKALGIKLDANGKPLKI